MKRVVLGLAAAVAAGLMLVACQPQASNTGNPPQVCAALNDFQRSVQALAALPESASAQDVRTAGTEVVLAYSALVNASTPRTPPAIRDLEGAVGRAAIAIRDLGPGEPPPGAARVVVVQAANIAQATQTAVNTVTCTS